MPLPMQILIRKYVQEIERLKQENKELREQLEKERELYYRDDDFADDDWGARINDTT